MDHLKSLIQQAKQLIAAYECLYFAVVELLEDACPGELHGDEAIVHNEALNALEKACCDVFNERKKG